MQEEKKTIRLHEENAIELDSGFGVTSLVQNALLFCVQRHFGQWREGEHPVPYAMHPIEVMSLVHSVANINDETILIAALLHDLLEETKTTPEEIEAAFGSRVLALVWELTRFEPSEEQIVGLTRAEIWELRSSILLSEIARMSKEAMTIKLADRLSNLREAKRTKSQKKLERYRKQSVAILGVVPRDVCPALWDLVQAEITRP